MNNFPTTGISLFLSEEMRKETDSDRLMDMAFWKARDAGMPSECVRAFAVGYLASVLGYANRLNNVREL